MKTRGFTLLEVVVASVASFLLVGLAIACWILAQRAWLKTYNLQTAQGSTLTSLSRLRDEYRRGKANSATLNQSVLTFLANDNGGSLPLWSSSGELNWSWWIQYRWLNNSLQRRQVKLAQPGPDPTESAPLWEPGQSGELLGPDLTSWQWSLQGGVLDVEARGLYQGASSQSRIMVLPFLYQPD